MIRLLIVFISALFSALPIFAQNNLASTWAFGISAGLKFDIPQPTPLNWQALRTFGGSAVLNDVNGNLIMYSNGSKFKIDTDPIIDSGVSGTFNFLNQLLPIVDMFL